MKQISVRWGDLGSPTEPGTYHCGPHMVEVTPGDIKFAEDGIKHANSSVAWLGS